jgi:tetratricopeptide (TPR) repeat protein
MPDAKHLLDLLDGAPDQDRERIWVASTVSLTPDDIRDAALADRACLSWLALRYDIGPPGRTLPDPAEAQATLLHGAGSAADAYAAIFMGPEVERGEEILQLLHNATVAAFAGGAQWLGAWLASRAALACLALGEPARAWEWLDALTQSDERHPEMEKVATFLPVRGHVDLESSPWVRSAVCFLWPLLEVHAIPVLAFPTDGDQELPEALARLEEVGAPEVRRLVETFLRSIASFEADRREDEPLVRELERRSLAGEGPPDVDILPAWFEGWSRQIGRGQRHRIGYLAGHLLHAHRHQDAALTAMLVLPLAKATDLPILRAGFDDQMRADLAELEEAATSVPARVADALVAVALPGHQRATQAIGALLPERDILGRLPARPGGVLAHVMSVINEIGASRLQDQKDARPHVAALHTAVRMAAERLGDPRQLSVSDVERAVASIAIPEITLGLLELSHETEQPSLDRLIQSLVLLRAVRGTPHEETWGPGLGREASQAIWRLGVVRLFELRIRLLDALIAKPGPLSSVAELHFQRANSRRGLQSNEDGAARQVVADLQAAATHARRNGELAFLADAVAVLARVAAEDDDVDAHADVARRLDEVLGLPVPPERRAMLLQAKAHLVRPADPSGAAELLGESIAHLPVDDAHRWEVSAERVLALVEASKVADAVAEGRALARVVTEHASNTVIAMVHHALGYALEAAGDLPSARAEFVRALDRTRGVDWMNEAANRLRLARVAILSDDEALWTQQLTVFRERWDGLGSLVQRDVASLVGEASRRGWVDPAIAADLVARVEAQQHPVPAAIASMQRARIALDAGEGVDLNRALREAIPRAETEEARGLVLELASNHGDGLGTDILQLVLEKARQWRKPVAEARILDRLGEAESACALLERALAGDLEKEDRMACTHLLITLLGEGRRAERLIRCQELEVLLAQGDDSATVRIDLAACYRLLATGDSALLDRAWTHGLRALGGLRGARDLTHGHLVVARVVDDIVRSRLGQTDPEIADQARWLLEDRPIAPDDLAQIRHAVAHNLLVPGPLCHPVALEVAEGFARPRGRLWTRARRRLPAPGTGGVASRPDVRRAHRSRQARGRRRTRGPDADLVGAPRGGARGQARRSGGRARLRRRGARAPRPARRRGPGPGPARPDGGNAVRADERRAVPADPPRGVG